MFSDYNWAIILIFAVVEPGASNPPLWVGELLPSPTQWNTLHFSRNYLPIAQQISYNDQSVNPHFLKMWDIALPTPLGKTPLCRLELWLSPLHLVANWEVFTINICCFMTNFKCNSSHVQVTLRSRGNVFITTPKDWRYCCEDITIFRIFKMATVCYWTSKW